MSAAPAQLRVGRLLKAHGLKGALKLELYTDDPARRFTPGAVFTLQVPTGTPWHGKTLTLAELRWYNGQPVAFFEGVDDRTAAESLVKAILWIDQPTDEPDEPDAWYDYQLVGLRALRDGAEDVLRSVRARNAAAFNQQDGDATTRILNEIRVGLAEETGWQLRSPLL